MMRDGRSGRANGIASLRKGLELLFLFEENQAELGLPDITARLGVPKSSAYRLAATLRASGMLVQEPASRRYRLGPRVLALQATGRTFDLRALALPHMQGLVASSGETAHLTERRGDIGVIVEVVESPHALRMAPQRGQIFELYAGALGRAILAFLAPADIARIVQPLRLRAFTPHTPATPEAVARSLRVVRLAGYACSQQEVTLGACGISAPIRGPDGWAVGSLGISGPLQRLRPERRRALVEPVCRAAAAVSIDVGRQPGRPGVSLERGGKS